jgi:hypothetical protein
MVSVKGDTATINGSFFQITSKISEPEIEDISEIFDSNDETPADGSIETVSFDLDIDEVNDDGDGLHVPEKITPSEGWLSIQDEDGDADNWSAGFGQDADDDGESQDKGRSKALIFAALGVSLITLIAVAAYMLLT